MIGRNLKRVFIFGSVFILIATLWIFRPYSSYDPKKLAPELRTLEEPIQLIEGCSYLDGGTVGIHLVDSTGTEQKFSFPVTHSSINNEYDRLFVGSMYFRDDGTKEIPFTDDTKIRLLEIMRKAPGISRDRDLAIAALSGRWRDINRIVVRKFVTKVY